MQTFTGAVNTGRREMVYALMLVALDLAAMMSAFEIGWWVRATSSRPLANVISEGRFATILVATLPLWVVIFGLFGLYRVQVHGGRVSEAGRVIAAVTCGVTLLTSFAYLNYGEAIFPSRSVPLIALITAIPLIIFGRQLVRSVMRMLFRNGRGRNNVILIGQNDLSQRFADKIAHIDSGYRLLAVVGDPEDKAWPLATKVPVFPTLESAVSVLSQHRIDEVIQTSQDVPRHEASRMMSFANEAGINYRFVPDKYGVFAAASRLSAIDGVPVMSVRLTALDGWGAVGKRTFDVVGAVVLITALSPVFLLIGLLVKIYEPDAPILYKQERIGLGGSRIKVFKFRSMSWRYSTGPDKEFKTAEDALVAMGRADLVSEFRANQKLVDDPRVSRLGSFLRKSSLDELPQLFNALTGQLSLVGPRPVTQGEIDRYGTQAASFLALKPGITGLWQVYGRSNTNYEERVKLDIYYVENWSPGMDVSILARTLISVAARRGAA